MGALMLAYRVVEAGGLDLSQIRERYTLETYLSADVPLWLRLRGYLAVVPYLIAVIQGLRDGRDGKPRWKLIAGVWLLGIPGGLATGGRDWILGILPVYVISFLLTRPRIMISRKALRRGGIAAAGCLAVALLFGLAGQVRDSDSYRGASANGLDWVLIPTASYLGVPIAAAGAYTEFATAEPLTMGSSTFEFLALQGERLGIVKTGSRLQYTDESRRYVQETDRQVIGYTHATVIPRLVGDFGEDLLIPAMAALTALFQYLGLVLPRTSIFAHAVAVNAVLYGGFFLFQDSLFFSSGPVLGVLAAAVLQRGCTRTPAPAVRGRALLGRPPRKAGSSGVPPATAC